MRKLKTVTTPKPQIEPAPQKLQDKDIKMYKKTFHQVSTIEESYLQKLGIKSVAVMEILSEDPIIPKLLIKKIDDTQYSVSGYKEITEHLNNLFFKNK